jgi:hypothetical protein
LADGRLEHRDLKAHLGRTRHRLLSVGLIELVEKLTPPQPPEQFRATIYDYTHQRTLLATGPVATPRRLVVAESGAQPLPSADEFAEAVSIVARHGEFKRKIADGGWFDIAMPPLVGVAQPDGRTERTLAVGLYTTMCEAACLVISVNRYPCDPRIRAELHDAGPHAG